MKVKRVIIINMLMLILLSGIAGCSGEKQKDTGELNSNGSVIPTWIDEPGKGSTEYESREALLSEFGVNDCDPIYQYFDQHHNLQLELYEDKDSVMFCGIVYDYYFDSNQEERKMPYGFAGSPAEKQTWIKEDAFSTKSVYGDDGTSYVGNPEEIMEYTPDGKLDYYRCQGLIEKETDGEIAEVLGIAIEIDYIYRDDGTLFCKKYRHEPRIWGTTLQTMESFYDESGRILYENGYITHGELEYYYIYEDDGDKPAYCLILDYAGGYAIPQIVQYD